MKLILNEDISKLGRKGDIVNVAKGYARNYLLPKNMAMVATAKNVTIAERMQEKRQVEQGSINARYTVELCKKDVPVYIGADGPLVKKREHADWFHGPDGMGNMNYPAPKLQETDADFIEVLNNHINQHPDEITMVTLGPLTNVANFIKRYPDSFLKLKNIVIMGGASNTVGNVTPAAEYNIWCDPEAADIVFKSRHHDIAMVGWELCRGKANLTEEEMELAYSFKTEKADFTIDCNKHALDSSQNWLGDPGLGLPDPVAMAVALNPDVKLNATDIFFQIAKLCLLR